MVFVEPFEANPSGTFRNLIRRVIAFASNIVGFAIALHSSLVVKAISNRSAAK